VINPWLSNLFEFIRRRKKEEGRRKKEEGRRKKEEGRRKKEEGRRKKLSTLFDLMPMPCLANSQFPCPMPCLANAQFPMPMPCLANALFGQFPIPKI
jgi:hypothetical protein